MLQCVLQCVAGDKLVDKFRVESANGSPYAQKLCVKNKKICASSWPSLRMATLPRSKYLEVCSGEHICRQLQGRVCEWQPFRVETVGVLQCVLQCMLQCVAGNTLVDKPRAESANGT